METVLVVGPVCGKQSPGRGQEVGTGEEAPRWTRPETPRLTNYTVSLQACAGASNRF